MSFSSVARKLFARGQEAPAIPAIPAATLETIRTELGRIAGLKATVEHAPDGKPSYEYPRVMLTLPEMDRHDPSGATLDLAAYLRTALVRADVMQHYPHGDYPGGASIRPFGLEALARDIDQLPKRIDAVNREITEAINGTGNPTPKGLQVIVGYYARLKGQYEALADGREINFAMGKAVTDAGPKDDGGNVILQGSRNVPYARISVTADDADRIAGALGFVGIDAHSIAKSGKNFVSIPLDAPIDPSLKKFGNTPEERTAVARDWFTTLQAVDGIYGLDQAGAKWKLVHDDKQGYLLLETELAPHVSDAMQRAGLKTFLAPDNRRVAYRPNPNETLADQQKRLNATSGVLQLMVLDALPLPGAKTAECVGNERALFGGKWKVLPPGHFVLETDKPELCANGLQSRHLTAGHDATTAFFPIREMTADKLPLSVLAQSGNPGPDAAFSTQTMVRPAAPRPGGTAPTLDFAV